MTALSNATAAFFVMLDEKWIALCEAVFKPILAPGFGLVDKILNPIYQPYATIIAVGFFLVTMIWVCFFLKESYVNLERPKIAWYTDLRLWTIVSMLPHVFVYFYFM